VRKIEYAKEFFELSNQQLADLLDVPLPEILKDSLIEQTLDRLGPLYRLAKLEEK
jgi:hypothetical protein